MSGNGLASLNENDDRSSVWFARWRCIPTCITRRSTRVRFHRHAIMFRELMLLLPLTVYWCAVFAFEFYSALNANAQDHNAHLLSWENNLKASKGDLESACSTYCNDMIYAPRNCDRNMLGNQYKHEEPLNLYMAMLFIPMLLVWLVGLVSLCCPQGSNYYDNTSFMGPSWLLMTFSECASATCIPLIMLFAVGISVLIYDAKEKDYVCKAACNGCHVSHDDHQYPDHWFPKLDIHQKMVVSALISVALPIFNTLFHQHMAKPACDTLLSCKCLPKSITVFAKHIAQSQQVDEETQNLLL